MGTKFEIEVWKKSDGGCAYEEFWRGESLIAALWNLYKAKREGHGCVTLHWR